MGLHALAEHRASEPTALSTQGGENLRWLEHSEEMRPKLQTSQPVRVHGDKSNLREPQKGVKGQRSNDA